MNVFYNLFIKQMKKLDIFLQKQRINMIREYIPLTSRCLDIGAYKGELFTMCKDKISEGVGIEPLLDAKLTGENFTIFPGYFPKDFPANNLGKFDLVTMLAVLEHIPTNEQKQLADHCYKLLNKGGVVIITVPSLMVDNILKVLIKLRLIDGMSLEEHHGFLPEHTSAIFSEPRFKLIVNRKFQIGMNNLFIFKKR